jgi:Holliday junction resolvase-like predicted endonuclease
MLAASQAYLQMHPELEGECRLDVIAIEHDRRINAPSVVHFENAVN